MASYGMVVDIKMCTVELTDPQHGWFKEIEFPQSYSLYIMEGGRFTKQDLDRYFVNLRQPKTIDALIEAVEVDAEPILQKLPRGASMLTEKGWVTIKLLMKVVCGADDRERLKEQLMDKLLGEIIA